MAATCDIGVTGLAVMGSNLAMNLCDHGYTVAGHNRTAEVLHKVVNGPAKGKSFEPYEDIPSFCASLKLPRRIMVMVKAGGPVDKVIEQLLPHLSPGDVIIDGGNSYFPDTVRRVEELRAKQINFVGMGVSGGEEGARFGPSLMPGGAKDAWPPIAEMFQAIAAKAPDGSPCCQYMGEGGAGHFVKMVHNGIEYGDMQLICETYALMQHVLGIGPKEQAAVFAEWNKGELDSYLIEITQKILGTDDPETGKPLVDVVLDTAGQKGTGKWTSVVGLDMGTPIPTITEAVFARCLSAVKEERVAAAPLLHGPAYSFRGDKAALLESLRQALFVSKICSYAQGFQLLKYASEEYDWNLDFGSIALVWRAGCIIRAGFLQHIKEAFDRNANLTNLLLEAPFNDIVNRGHSALREVVIRAAEAGVPIPCMSSALAYYDGYRADRLPANLLQAQRDFFGSHTYERIDKPRGDFFHTDWMSL